MAENELKQELLRISGLMAEIAQKYPFSSEKYKRLKPDARPDEILEFGVRHSLLHMTKSLGVIATVLEKTDHSGVLRDSPLREVTVKSVINALNLANVLGISAEELV